MIESYRALIIIIGLSSITFWLLFKPLSKTIQKAELSRWRNIWIALVVATFLSPSFWIFALAAFVLLYVLGPREAEQRIVYYILLMCALPNLSSAIPGFAGINYIFHLNYSRILIFVFLLPLLFFGKNDPLSPRKFGTGSDWLLILFLSLESILLFRDNTTTNAMRESFLLFVDVFTPYYVISRYITSPHQFRNIFFVLLISIVPFTLIGIFETARHWHLYHEIRLVLSDVFIEYSRRSDLLRATAVFASPIALGYVLTIGFGALLFAKPYLDSRKKFYLLAIFFILALLSTISRGAWLGFGVLVITYILLGQDRIKHLAIGLISFLLLIPFISLTPFWDKFIQLLPFVGSADSGTISYRQRLIEQAWIVFQRNPVFGSATYRDTAEMESMRQGQGIIDVVNSYIHIVLSTGVVGLSLFILFFLTLLLGIYRSMRRLPEHEIEMLRLGRVLFATITSILFMIATVSSIDYIPVFYWLFAGLSAAYIFLATNISDSSSNSEHL